MQPSDEILIREYQDGDEVQINLLYNHEYGKHRSLEEWQWEFREGPYGKSIFVVAEHNGEIIGTRAQLPMLLSYGEQEILSAKNEHSLVKKEYRGQRIFQRLCDECITLATRRDIALLWGFSYAEKAYRRAGFQIPGRLRHLLLILNPSQAYQIYRDMIPAEIKDHIPCQVGQKLLLRTLTLAGFLWFKTKKRTISPSPRFDVVSITRADHRLDAFWEVFCHQGKSYTIARSSSYLDWRVFRNPNMASKLLAAVENDRIQGYVIAGRSKHDNAGYIIDFCILDEHFEEVAGLLMSHAGCCFH